jgi:hypothetical protein
MVHRCNLICDRVALAGYATTGVAFDFLGVTRGLSQGLGNYDLPPTALLIIDSVQLRSSHRAPNPEPMEHTHSPDFWAHLGLLEVSSNTSCNVLVSGAVLDADLRDIYRGTAVIFESSSLFSVRSAVYR